MIVSIFPGLIIMIVSIFPGLIIMIVSALIGLIIMIVSALIGLLVMISLPLMIVSILALTFMIVGILPGRLPLMIVGILPGRLPFMIVGILPGRLPLMIVRILAGLLTLMVVRILAGLLIMRIPADRLFVALQHLLSHFEQVHPLLKRNIQHIRHPLFEGVPRRQHQVGPVNGVHQLRGRNIIMRVGPDRHHNVHPGPVSRHIARDVAQNGGGGQDYGLGGDGGRNVLLVHRFFYRRVASSASRRQQNGRRQRRPTAPPCFHLLFFHLPSLPCLPTCRRFSIMITNIIRRSNYK